MKVYNSRKVLRLSSAKIGSNGYDLPTVLFEGINQPIFVQVSTTARESKVNILSTALANNIPVSIETEIFGVPRVERVTRVTIQPPTSTGNQNGTETKESLNKVIVNN